MKRGKDHSPSWRISNKDSNRFVLFCDKSFAPVLGTKGSFPIPEVSLYFRRNDVLMWA